MILITGGGGFIGLNTARALVDMGQEVLLVRRHAFQLPSFLTQYADKQVKVAECDIVEIPAFYKLIKAYNVDSIIHLANLREGIGSLYQVLRRLHRDGLIEEADSRRIRLGTDARRQYFQLTRFGGEVFRLEASRLYELLAVARDVGLISEPVWRHGGVSP